MLVEAALNGGRTRADNPDIPLTPDELAMASRDSVAAGAGAIHFHVRAGDGRESLDPRDVAAAVAAVRAAVPSTPFGVSTGAWILNDSKLRLKAVAAWTALPDFASVNFTEEGASELAKLLISRGIAIEAAVSNVHGTEIFARSKLAPKCLRVLMEPMDQILEKALWMVDSIETVLDRARIALPRLLHGMNQVAWQMIDVAAKRGYDTRVGFEDILKLPDGAPAASNAALVGEVVRRTGR
jgi:uncharacterized protein (DUF849 family)